MVVGLEAFLRQNETAASIVKYLRDDAHPLARLTGASGAGKSYTARLAAAIWRSAGGRVVIATGDDVNCHRKLYPLLSGTSGLRRRWQGLAVQGSRSAAGVADAAFGAGGIATSVFDLLASALRSRHRDHLRHLAPVERDVVEDVQRLSRSNGLLLIADAAHYWDADSLALLHVMLSPPLRSSVPQLQNLSALVVDTEQDQDVVAPTEFNRLCEASSTATWHLELVDRERFGDVLEHLGLRDMLDANTLGALHDITGGHLKLAEQLVAYLNAGQRTTWEQLVQRGDGVKVLLEGRLRSLDSSSAELSEMLTRAAVIGATFALEEIQCLTTDASGDAEQLLERANSINFVESELGALRFSHDVLREHFLNAAAPPELRRLRSMYERCLQSLRPADYATRAALLLEAEDRSRGRELLALASIAELRRGRPSERVLRDAMAELPDDNDLHTYLERIASAYEAVASGDYGAPGAALLTPTAGESTAMAAERNYLRALCAMESETADGMADALRILRQWQNEVEHEPELALRFLLLCQQAEVLNEDFDAALSTEATIEQQLVARRVSDSRAARLSQIQNRRSGALYVPEFAEVRIAESVKFFGRTADQEMGDALEFYRALTNHAAILIKLSRNADALAAAREAERLLIDRPTLLPRPDVLAGNLVLAARRDGAFSLDEAIAHQRGILRSPEGANDGFIHRCNLISYLLQARQDQEASDLLDGLTSQISQAAIAETYLIYYWHVLSLSAALVAGRPERARTVHSDMEDFVMGLEWPNAPYVKRRHELLGGLVDSVDPGEPRDQLDLLILHRFPSAIGPGWEYHARLFPCCVLSFWSDA